MSTIKLKYIFVAGAFAVQFAAPLRESQAGPIIDWLFNRNQQPVVAQPIYAAPAVSLGTPVAADPCACQPVVTNYQPQTYFRTAWVQVPVTNYRPISAVDPRTGCPVTTLSPCTTYMWQARRMPTWGAYRPIYTAVAAPVVAAPVVAAPACGVGCNSCGVSAPTAAPYYSPAATTSTYPSGAVRPGASAPGILGTGSPTPADQQPSLSPTSDPSTRNYAPLDPAFPPPASSGLPLTAPTGVQKKPAVEKSLKFVPDPDAGPPASEPNRAPQLRVPRDRTASAAPRRDWAYTPIQWSGGNVRPASAEAPVRAEPPRLAPAPEVWDDTGWRSLRP